MGWELCIACLGAETCVAYARLRTDPVLDTQGCLPEWAGLVLSHGNAAACHR
jgi:hypothetical protein